MKHTRGYIRLLVLFAFLALCGAGEASAQVPLDRYRSAKTFVRSGLMPKPDSLAKNHLTDSLLLMRVDSLLQDSTLRDSLLRSGIDRCGSGIRWLRDCARNSSPTRPCF